MVAYSRRDGERRLGFEAGATAERCGGRGAGLSVLSRPALTDIVQERGQEQVVETAEVIPPPPGPWLLPASLRDVERLDHGSPEMNVHGMPVEGHMLRQPADVAPLRQRTLEP